jgi:hypothetical protein
MKLIKLIFILVSLGASIQILAQDLDPSEVYYALEYLPTTTSPDDTSTTVQVVVVMESSDLNLFNSITVESSKKSKELKVSKEERKDNPRIKQKNEIYQLDMLEWSEDEELMVKGKMPDGTKVKLKKHPRGSEFTHKVVTVRPKTRDLKKHEGPEIVEQENEQ